MNRRTKSLCSKVFFFLKARKSLSPRRKKEVFSKIEFNSSSFSSSSVSCARRKKKSHFQHNSSSRKSVPASPLLFLPQRPILQPGQEEERKDSKGRVVYTPKKPFASRKDAMTMRETIFGKKETGESFFQSLLFFFGVRESRSHYWFLPPLLIP